MQLSVRERSAKVIGPHGYRTLCKGRTLTLTTQVAYLLRKMGVSGIEVVPPRLHGFFVLLSSSRASYARDVGICVTCMPVHGMIPSCRGPPVLWCL